MLFEYVRYRYILHRRLGLTSPMSICSHPNQAAYAKHLPSPLPRHPTKARLTKPPQLTVSKFPKPETAKSLKPPPLPAIKPEAQSALPPSSPESPPPPPTRKPEVQSALPPSSPESPLPRSGPSTSILAPAITYDPAQGLYVVRDRVGNCGVVHYKPSATSGLKIIEKSNYAECKDVVEKEALIGAVEQGAEAKFKAAQAKAEKLGGVDKLTPKDIEGLSIEQIKQLRGY